MAFDQSLKQYVKIQDNLKANVASNNQYAEKLVADAQSAITSVSAASAAGGAGLGGGSASGEEAMFSEVRRKENVASHKLAAKPNRSLGLS